MINRRVMRKNLVAGNWKMNMTNTQAKELLNKLVKDCKSDNTDIVFCPPYVDLALAIESVKGTQIKIGAQNVHFEDSGAFTGEISAKMLVDMGVEYVILGHSERREYFAETDSIINKKVLKAIEEGLKVILCCGETLEQREQGITIDFIRQQLKVALQGVCGKSIKDVTIAYEPIWAIGTGKVATKEQAQDVCKAIRDLLNELYGDVSNDITIQYGGSVNGGNAEELFEQPDIDGALVGGASLKEDFINIIKAM